VTEFIRGVATGSGLGNFPGVVVLTRDLFNAIEFDAACSGDHQAAARQMSELANTGTQTDEFPRSEAFVRAGEQWLLADDPVAAANGFRRALADGGPAFTDPRVPLARALFLMDRPDEADTLIRQLEAELPGDPRICDLVAELLVECSDLPGALRWATAGVELCLGRAARAGSDRADSDRADSDRADSDRADSSAAESAAKQVLALPDAVRTELQLLLRLRYRVRNDLGLQEDGYDLLLDGLGGLAGLSPEPTGAADTG
jgi:predicted Zn-dependent protease